MKALTHTEFRLQDCSTAPSLDQRMGKVATHRLLRKTGEIGHEQGAHPTSCLGVQSGAWRLESSSLRSLPPRRTPRASSSASGNL